MRFIGECWRRVWYLLNRRRLERELREDMEAHAGTRSCRRSIGIWVAAFARAAACGVGIYGVAACLLNRPGPAGFVLGYSRLSPGEISKGLRRLGDVL